MTTISPDQLRGRTLYGDDFSESQIAEWFKDEERGYYNLKQSGAHSTYGYNGLNDFHAFSLVKRRSGQACLAFGCAGGDDVAPLASSVSNYIAVEPARNWWVSEIGGRPAEYRMPTPGGELSLDDKSVDLVTSLGVLHHIPNVSFVLSEFARVLRPGGLLLLREPISSMGDWSKPRLGLTARERGLPAQWLSQRLKERGFKVRRRRYCMFPATIPFARRLKLRPYNSRPMVVIDWITATLFSWNRHYWRDAAWKKVAPGSVFIVAERWA